jgi:hypothetical protein
MCDGRERAISDWLKQYRGCETDSDCELSENNYGGCVAEFLCGFALNVNVDRGPHSVRPRSQAEDL